MARPKLPPSVSPHSPDPAVRLAILMDAGAMYFAVRELYGEGQVDYTALVELITDVYLDEGGPVDVSPIMWSSVVPQNTGQVRFLDYAEQRLGWAVRRFPPSEAFMVDPASTPGLTIDGRGQNRLIRFDASMAFAMGHFAKDHRIAVISD